MVYSTEYSTTSAPVDDGLLAFALIGLAVFLVFALVFHILAAIGLSGIAQNSGESNTWMAWIPIVNYFLLTKLVEDDAWDTFKGKLTLIFGVSLILSMVLGAFLPFVSIVPSVLLLFAMYHITNRYSNNVGVNMILLILTGGAWASIQLFRYRNRESLIDSPKEFA